MRASLIALASLALSLVSGCPSLPRERVSELPDLGYPSCGERPLPPGERIVEGALRPGPIMQEGTLVERFEVTRRDCLTVFRGRQEWALSAIDLDVVYDADLLPVRVWQRMVVPGPQPLEARTDLRLFDLRTPRVALTRRRPSGEHDRFFMRGARPRAVIGPGRGLLTMWLRRARLEVGGRLRESALDIRESFEVVRDVTLMRLGDDDHPLLGRVRVYTIYGREPIYANDDDVVVGDMMGLVRAELVSAPLPPPIETGVADPTTHP